MRFGSVVAQEDLEWITLRASFNFFMLVLMDIAGNAQLGMGQSPGSLVGNQNSWLMDVHSPKRGSDPLPSS